MQREKKAYGMVAGRMAESQAASLTPGAICRTG